MANGLSALIALVPDPFHNPDAMRLVDILAAGLQSRFPGPPVFSPEAEEDRAKAVSLGWFSGFDCRGMRQETLNSLRKTGARIPNPPVSNPEPVPRAAAVRGDRAGGGVRFQAHHRGGALGRAWRAGNRAGRDHQRGFPEAGEPLILISHNMLEVFDLIERIVAFRRGRMVANPRRVASDGQEAVASVAGARSGRENVVAALGALAESPASVHRSVETTGGKRGSPREALPGEFPRVASFSAPQSRR